MNLLWRNVRPEPAKTYQVFAPDMLNYGKSDKSADANVSIEAQSRLIVKLMDQLGLKAADIVAHDIGGGVAQLIAVYVPADADGKISRLLEGDRRGVGVGRCR